MQLVVSLFRFFFCFFLLLPLCFDGVEHHHYILLLISSFTRTEYRCVSGGRDTWRGGRRHVGHDDGDEDDGDRSIGFLCALSLADPAFVGRL
uniref:Secreted protein n=1 Tax=Oryza sativa subsp. japonica TaxID=39947 RepID=Q5VRQ4_ORYSJ|nr:hypothetical protein [Oryza sativa Japonica Group]BAD67874.1 hypothetical protein [Oryza sativa Japonica Group]